MVGTVGFRMLGGVKYSWLDCFYMTFITITTIGYNEVVDVTRFEYGRLFTIFIGLTGIGILGYVISTITAFILERDLNMEYRRRKMRQKIAGVLSTCPSTALNCKTITFFQIKHQSNQQINYLIGSVFTKKTASIRQYSSFNVFSTSLSRTVVKLS